MPRTLFAVILQVVLLSAPVSSSAASGPVQPHASRAVKQARFQLPDGSWALRSKNGTVRQFLDLEQHPLSYTAAPMSLGNGSRGYGLTDTRTGAVYVYDGAWRYLRRYGFSLDSGERVWAQVTDSDTLFFAQSGEYITSLSILDAQKQADESAEKARHAAEEAYRALEEQEKRLDAQMLELERQQRESELRAQRAIEEANRPAPEPSAGRRALGMLGAVLSGVGQGLSSAPGRSGSQVATPRTCSSDFECGVGSTCVKSNYSVSGYCARSMDAYGVQQFNTPRTESVGVKMPSRRDCQFDTDCPIGFSCDSNSGACLKR